MPQVLNIYNQKLKYMNKELQQFYKDQELNIKKQCSDEFKNLGVNFIEKTLDSKYSYNFSWMGRPIIAYPQDMIAMQEIIWEIQPDLIIETGVAHGGSIVYYASLLELIGNNGIVIGIDIDIRKHNRELIEAHPMSKRIHLIEGSSTSDTVFNEVMKIANQKSKILICLDSNHTHDHVLKELQLYAPLASINSYCIVFDTVIEHISKEYTWNRPWGVGNNPGTAVNEFIKHNSDFIIDENIQNKLLITVAPGGYLKRIK